MYRSLESIAQGCANHCPLGEQRAPALDGGRSPSSRPRIQALPPGCLRSSDHSFMQVVSFEGGLEISEIIFRWEMLSVVYLSLQETAAPAGERCLQCKAVLLPRACGELLLRPTTLILLHPSTRPQSPRIASLSRIPVDHLENDLQHII